MLLCSRSGEERFISESSIYPQQGIDKAPITRFDVYNKDTSISGGSVARAESAHGHRTEADRAYAAIKSDLLSLKLRPGSIIQEEVLALQLGLSRTPVREALHRLGQEGLVRTLPKKGTIVADISLDDVREVFQVRLAVEPLAARLAAEVMPREEIHRLIELHSAPRESTDEFPTGDRELHRSIARHCGNRRLGSFLESLMDETTRILHMSNPAALALGHEHHLRILQAMEARDGATAEQIMREHILTLQRSLISQLLQ